MSAEGLKAWAAGALSGVENLTLPSFVPGLRELDEEGIRWDVRQTVAHGFTSTLCACDAGLTPEEAGRFVAVVADEAGDRLTVGLTMPRDSFDLGRRVLERAEAAGCRHALIGFPLSFLPGGDDDVHDAVARIAAETGLALVLPVSADVAALGFPAHMPIGAYERLAGLPNVVGLHVAVFSAAILFEAHRRFGERLVVGLGAGDQLGALPMLHKRFGASWLAAANWELWQSPERPYVVEFQEHVAAGRHREALALHWRLGPARAIAFQAGLLHAELAGMAHWPLAKYVGWTVGGNGGLTRDPAMRLKPHEIDARRAMLRTLGIEGDEPFEDFLRGRAAAAA